MKMAFVLGDITKKRVRQMKEIELLESTEQCLKKNLDSQGL